MAAISVQIDLSVDEAKLIDAYIEEHCLDREKWLKRMLYGVLYKAVGRWKHPQGKIAPAFDADKAKIAKEPRKDMRRRKVVYVKQ